jgi:FtsH-binding integral membrane protein
MDNNNNYQWAHKSVIAEQQTGMVAKKFFANVFLWMFVALSLSTVAALVISTSPAALSQLVNFETGQRTVLGYIAMFAPLGLVLLMGAGFSRLSYGTLSRCLHSYSQS